jgi:hypothetical protein
MMRIGGKVLHTCVRLSVVFVSLWLLLALPAPLTASAFADDSKICTAQTTCSNACCGCGGGNFGRPSCPGGYSPYDDYCLPDCPSGFVRYPGYPGFCMPPCQHGCPEGYDQVPLPNCPPYHVRDINNPDRCIPDYGRLNNLDSCPPGLEYASETGRCESICGYGQYRDTAGLCQSYYERECPQGLARDAETGKCLPPGIWPPSYQWVCLRACPQGWTRDIRHPTRCLPPPTICDEGWVLQNGRCLPDCLPGTTRDNYGYCVPVTCPDGSYPNLRGECVQIGCPDGQTRNGNGVCEPPIICPNGQVMSIEGKCEDPGCPQGQEKVRGECTTICKIGTTRDDNGDCVPDIPDCERGQHYNDVTQQCERDTPKTPTCKKGETYSTKLRRCVGRYVPPPEICKDGYVKDRNGRCVLVRIPEPDCPRDMKPDGNGGCIPIIRLVPRNCPDNMIFNKRTRKCEFINLQPRNPIRVIPQDNGGDNGDGTDNGGKTDQPPTIRQLNPRIKLNQGVIEQLIPQKVPRGDINMQAACPDGTFRDNNGRCVTKQ